MMFTRLRGRQNEIPLMPVMGSLASLERPRPLIQGKVRVGNARLSNGSKI